MYDSVFPSHPTILFIKQSWFVTCCGALRRLQGMIWVRAVPIPISGLLLSLSRYYGFGGGRLEPRTKKVGKWRDGGPSTCKFWRNSDWMARNFDIKGACKTYFTQCTIILGPRGVVMVVVSSQTEQR